LEGVRMIGNINWQTISNVIEILLLIWGVIKTGNKSFAFLDKVSKS
jgi:hypothetical protein